jgi:hypothetical protein
MQDYPSTLCWVMDPFLPLELSFLIYRMGVFAPEPLRSQSELFVRTMSPPRSLKQPGELEPQKRAGVDVTAQPGWDPPARHTKTIK